MRERSNVAINNTRRAAFHLASHHSFLRCLCPIEIPVPKGVRSCLMLFFSARHTTADSIYLRATRRSTVRGVTEYRTGARGREGGFYTARDLPRRAVGISERILERARGKEEGRARSPPFSPPPSIFRYPGSRAHLSRKFRDRADRYPLSRIDVRREMI